MNSEVELDTIIEVVNRAKRIGIFTHVSPDGDAIGSSLGLYIALKQLGKDVELILDDYSRCFNFLPCLDEIMTEGTGQYDLAIALDCAARKRLFDPKNYFDQSKGRVSIDHHASNTYFAEVNYVEGASPAVCKTLVKVLKRLNVSMNQEIGQCLMAGIITDSGGFRYDTADDETFEFAAQMLDLGVNISKIYYQTFDLKTRAQFQLSSLATSRLKFYHHSKIALTYVTREDMLKAKAQAGDHEGIVNIGRNIEGIEVSIFLREEEIDVYKVSFRSNEMVDVAEIAKVFDGGGHSKAAGCTIEAPLDVAVKKLVKETSRRL